MIVLLVVLPLLALAPLLYFVGSWRRFHGGGARGGLIRARQGGATRPGARQVSFTELHGWRERVRPVRPASPTTTTSSASSASFARCSGPGNDYAGWRYRSCALSNVCYERDSASWHVYRGGDNPSSPSPTTSTPSHLPPASFLVFDADFGPLDVLGGFRESGLVSETMELQDERFPTRRAWGAKVLPDAYPWGGGGQGREGGGGADPPPPPPRPAFESAGVSVPQTVQTWFPNTHLFYDCNIGHLLWDWSLASTIAATALGEPWGLVSPPSSSSSPPLAAATSNASSSSSSSWPHSPQRLLRRSVSVVLLGEFPLGALFLEACQRSIPAVQPSGPLPRQGEASQEQRQGWGRGRGDSPSSSAAAAVSAAHGVTTVLDHALDVAGRQGSGRPPPLLCFRSLLVGGHTYHIRHDAREPFFAPTNVGREASLVAHRALILRRVKGGVDPLASPRTPPLSLSRPRVVFVRKLTSFGAPLPRRAIVNLDAAVEWVAAAFPGADVSVSVVEPYSVGWEAGLRSLVQTTVLVTPCGGISTTLPFLPLGASAVVADYPDPATGRSVSMEGQLWGHVPHVRVFYYQMRVGPKDAAVEAGEGGGEGEGEGEGVEEEEEEGVREDPLLLGAEDGPDWVWTRHTKKRDPRHDTVPVFKRSRIVSLVRAALQAAGRLEDAERGGRGGGSSSGL